MGQEKDIKGNKPKNKLGDNGAPDWETWLDSFDALYAALTETGLRPVLQALGQAEDPAPRAMSEALKSAADILELVPSQLAPQILSRLRGTKVPGLGPLLAGAAAWRDEPWLMPLGAGLAELETSQAGSFQAHLDFIGALGVLPDGKRLVSASEDGTIRIWALSPEGSLPLTTLEDHQGSVNDIAVSPDGKRLASASDDHTVKVWDLETLDCRLTLTGHTDYVSAVVVMPEGRAASASKDGSIRIWDLASGDCLAVFAEHEAWVNALAVAPDGRLLVSSSINNRIKCWDMGTLTETEPFFEFEMAGFSRVVMGNVFFTPANTGDVGHRKYASALAFSPDGQTLVSAGTEMILWDAASRRQVVRFPAHAGPVQDLVWLDGNRLATAAEVIKIWDLDARRSLRTFSGHLGEVTSLAASGDGRWLISGSQDRTIKYWDLARQIPENLWRGHRQTVNSVDFSPDERWALSVGKDGQARLWDTASGRCRHVLDRHAGKIVYSGGFSPDGETVVTTTSDSEVAVWEVAEGKLRHMLRHPKSHFHPSGFTILPGGRCAVCSGIIHPLAVWDLAEGGDPEILPETPNHLLDTAVTREGRCFAAVYFADEKGASAASTVKEGPAARQAPLQWWDFPARKVLWDHLPEGDPLEVGYFCRARLTADDRRLFAATSRGWLGVFDTADGTRLAWWRGHPLGYVHDIRILPDGRLLTCGHEVVAQDARGRDVRHFFLRWWDLKTGENLRTLHLADADARTPQITADGALACFVTGQRVCLWDLDADAILASFYGATGMQSAAISRDGRTILAGEKGGAVHVLRPVACRG